MASQSRRDELDEAHGDSNNNNNNNNNDQDECKLAPNPTSTSWHLLDVDGQSVAASSVSSSSELDQQEQSLIDQKLEEELVKKRSTLARRRNRTSINEQSNRMVSSPNSKAPLSPGLIYFCTALYALLPLASILAFVTLVALLFTRFWFITVIYYTLLILDSNTCNRGGRRLDFFHKGRFWSYMAAYFPIQLKYSQNFSLSPEENYILNYHPHGISAFGCVCAFATDGLNFSQLFPGIKSRFMVHETSFLVPVMRETFSFRGDCSVNSKSFDYILSKKWKQKDEKTTEPRQHKAGNLLALCGGGLAEADLSKSETLSIVAATRKGFVKKALIHGANLIPCIAFGENSVFNKINFKPGSLLHRAETKFYQLFKFKHPIYFGRSLLAPSNKSRTGALPYKRPITVIMADPIMVERVENPSQEQIDQLHGAYIERLKSLYEANKGLCTRYDVKMEIV